MIARALVLLAVIAAIVLLAGELRVARDVDRAVALSGGGRSTGEAREAATLLRASAGRTADTTPLLRLAQLGLFAGRPREALGPARQAARREPENAQAWLLVAQAATAAGDPGLAAEARRRVAALVAGVAS